MKGIRIVLCLLLSITLALPAAAAPLADDWAGWFTGLWAGIVDAFSGSGDEDDDPDDDEPPPPAPIENPTTDCTTCGGGDDTESGPSIDPNG